MPTAVAIAPPLAGIGYLLSRALIYLALFHLFPILVALQSGEYGAAYAFIVAALLSAFGGGALTLAYRDVARPSRRRDAILLPVVGLPVLALFAGIGLRFAGATTGFGAAFFEALSGLTTTGASVIADVDAALRSVLAWRAMLEWLGGLIAIGYALAIAPSLDIGGAGLTNNVLPHGEGESMTARFRGILPPLIPIYTALTALCLVSLWIGGLPAFDALCHAMATLSSGGFSTRTGSLAAFNAPLAEVLAIPFMLAAAVNATYHWAALRGRFRAFATDRELRLLMLLIGLGALVIATGHLAQTAAAGAGDWLASLRAGLFSAVSAASTTGFVGSSSTPPTLLGVYVLSALVFAGGMTGSTAGGLKAMRVIILFRHAYRELSRLAHPSSVRAVRLNQRAVSEGTLLGVWTLYFAFLSSLALLVAAFTATGADLSTSFFLGLSAISNAGPIIYTLDPEFAGFPAVGTSGRAIYAVGMVVGRLEVMTILAVFAGWLWRD